MKTLNIQSEGLQTQIKSKVIRDVKTIALVVLLAETVIGFTSYHLAKPTAYLSPLPLKAYAMEDFPMPSIPVMAEVSEQEKNTRIIKKIWGKDWETGVAIAKCESGLRAGAINPSNSDGSGDYGLFQINTIHGWTEEEMLNPISNTGVAYSKFVNQGVQPWYSSQHCWGDKI